MKLYKSTRVFKITSLIILAILPFLCLALYYHYLPQQIPIFLNFLGNPLKVADKTVFTVFRLPTMSLLLQFMILLVHLHIIHIANQITHKKTRNYIVRKSETIFFNISLIISLKLGFSLFEVLLRYNGQIQYALFFRYATLLIVIIGVFLIIKNYLQLDRVRRINKKDFKSFPTFFKLRNSQHLLLIVLLIFYLIVTFLPLWI